MSQQKDVEEVARNLAEVHLKLEPDEMLSIDWYPAPGEVRLVEVQKGLPSIGVVWPLRFGPTDDVPFRAVVILLGEEDNAAVERNVLALPAGWEKPVRLFPKQVA